MKKILIAVVVLALLVTAGSAAVLSIGNTGVFRARTGQAGMWGYDTTNATWYSQIVNPSGYAVIIDNLDELAMSGEVCFISDYEGEVDTSKKYALVTSADKLVRINFEFSAGMGGQVGIYDSTTSYDNNGVILAAYNYKRSSTATGEFIVRDACQPDGLPAAWGSLLFNKHLHSSFETVSLPVDIFMNKGKNYTLVFTPDAVNSKFHMFIRYNETP